MMYVGAKEGKNKNNAEIGIYGRIKRENDSKELEIVYVEEN